MSKGRSGEGQNGRIERDEDVARFDFFVSYIVKYLWRGKRYCIARNTVSGLEHLLNMDLETASRYFCIHL